MKPEIIAFTLNTIIFAVLACTAYVSTSDREMKFLDKLRRNAFKITCFCTGISLLLLVLDVSGFLSFGGYHLLSLWNVLFEAVLILFLKFSEKIPERFRKITRFSVRSLTICMALELFVFNFNSAHLFLGDYPEKVLDMTSATVENFDPATGQNIGAGYSSIEFKGINTPVGTVTFEAESDKKGFVNFSIDMSDETNSAAYRGGIASAQVLRDNERSETIPCNFSGTVYDIKFSFNTAEEETVTLTKITINKPIMLDFSLLRFSILFFGSLIVYILASSDFFKRSYSENRKGIKAIAWIFTGVLLIASLWLANITRYTDENHSLIKDFKSESGNQITQSIVDAFADGRTTMDIEMNEILAGLENPYDGSQREAAQVGAYPWDHLYFDGAYYSYYGIGPVLTLFLPYYLLTGYYFPSVWAVWLFGFLGIVFLTKFYLCFIDKFFRSTRSSLIVLGLVLIQLSSGIWFCFNCPNFYEIAQTSGFVCTTAGAFFMISSNVIGEGKIKNWRLALSAVFLSLAVLCRPTLAVYCVAALLFIYAGFRKKMELYSHADGSKMKQYAPYFVSALLPFIIIGSIQMFYNYVRFGNPFDFGIQYSLTINDFTSTEFHTHLSAIGFFNYLLVIPKFSKNFPFLIPGDVQTFDPQGYYFIATASALGLLWKVLPILSYGKSLKAYRITDNKNKKLYTLLIFTVCIACPFVVIASIWESGYGARYCVDFAWQIIIGALIVAFIVYEKCRDNTRNHLNKLMIISAVICLILNFAQTFTWIGPENYLSADWQSDALSFARVFEFWR